MSVPTAEFTRKSAACRLRIPAGADLGKLYRIARNHRDFALDRHQIEAAHDAQHRMEQIVQVAAQVPEARRIAFDQSTLPWEIAVSLSERRCGSLNADKSTRE